MCVLIVKPAGVPVPDADILEACAIQNPHGFGFATPSRYFRTMSASAFIHACSLIDPSEPALIHLRYSTHGSRKVGNCHPFYSSANGGTYFAHNGVLPIRSVADMTDSEIAFKSMFVPAIRQYGYDSPELDEAVADIIGGSKFAFLNKNGEVKTYGHFTEVCGCLFSNLHWSGRYDLLKGRGKYRIAI